MTSDPITTAAAACDPREIMTHAFEMWNFTMPDWRAKLLADLLIADGWELSRVTHANCAACVGKGFVWNPASARSENTPCPEPGERITWEPE